MRRLTAVERVRLREGLSRVHNAPHELRVAAIDALVAATRRGVVFPSPAEHDEATCPFHKIERYPVDRLGAAIERVAAHQPLQAAVALCHVSATVRETVWKRLSDDARAPVLGQLEAVPGVSTVQTREMARDLTNPAQPGRATGERSGTAALSTSSSPAASGRGRGIRNSSTSCCTHANTMTAPNTWNPTSSAGISLKYCT